MKNNQTGFGLLAVLVPIIVISAAGFTGWYVWHKNKTESNAKSASQANQDRQNKNDTSEPARVATPQEEIDNQDQLLKNHMSRLAAAVNEYAANNLGTFPQDLVGIRADVEDDTKPQGKAYKPWENAGPITKGKPNAATFYYATGHTCNPATNLMSADGTKRMSAIVVLLPSGSAYCAEN